MRLSVGVAKRSSFVSSPVFGWNFTIAIYFHQTAAICRKMDSPTDDVFLQKSSSLCFNCILSVMSAFFLTVNIYLDGRFMRHSLFRKADVKPLEIFQKKSLVNCSPKTWSVTKNRVRHCHCFRNPTQCSQKLVLRTPLNTCFLASLIILGKLIVLWTLHRQAKIFLGLFFQLNWSPESRIFPVYERNCCI